MTDIAKLSVKVTTQGIEIANRELEKLGNVADTTEKKTTKLGKAAKAISGAFTGLSGAISAVGFGFAARAIADYTDRMASMQGQLKLVTGSQAELNDVYQKALSLANETGQSLEATVNLYARLSRSTEELRLSQDSLFTITKAINQSFIVSGASAQEASSAILQLSQGLAAGALRGEELNSVMENSPRLARALADGLGVSIGQLREMGKEGELTAEAVTRALESMADEIDAEFQQMPMTIGRSMQEIRNILLDTFGAVDADPIVDALEGIKKMLMDPAMKMALQDFAAGVLNLGASAIKAAAGIADLGRSIGEGLARAVSGGSGAGSIDGLIDNYNRLDKTFKTMLANGHENSRFMDDIREDMKKLESVLELTGDKLVMVNGQWTLLSKSLKEKSAPALGYAEVAFDNVNAVIEKMNAATRMLSKETAESTELTKEQQKAQEKAEKAIESARKETEKLTEANRSLIVEMEWENALLGMSERDREIVIAQRKLNAEATQEERERVSELTGAMYDHNAALEAAEEATRKAEEAQKPFRDAITATVERIDGAFANAWKGAFDSFDSFKDSLVDAFKNLLAELAHLAISKPILMSIGASVGLVPASASAAASQAASSILGSFGSGGGGGILSSLGSGITGSIGGLYSNASQFLLNSSYSLGTDTMLGGFLNDAGLGAGQMANAGFGTMALTAGGGIVGGLAGTALGSSLFGKDANSAFGSTIGGLAGSVFGPVGSFAGAAIGGLVDSLFGSSNKTPDRGARAILDASTGSVQTLGRDPSDPKFSQANFDSVQGAVALLAQYSQIVGGSGEFNISQGDRRGVAMNGTKFSSMADAIAKGIKDLTSSATELDPAIKRLVNNFRGAGEETLIFAEALVSIGDMIKDNPVDRAIEDFASAQEQAGLTLTTAYNAQVDAIREMISGFDGSAESAMALNSAMAQNQQAAYQLAVAIQQISEQISGTLGASAQRIRESVMTAEERDRMNRDRRNELRGQLGTLTDVDAIASTVAEIDRLTSEIYGALPQELQNERAEQFAQYLERVDEVAQRQLDRALDSVRRSQNELQNNTQQMLNSFSQNVTDAGDTMLQAAQIMASLFGPNGGRAISLGAEVG